MVEKSLFLGCTIPGRIPFVEKSAKLVCEDLGIDIEYLEGASCCPDPVGINALDKDTWMAIAGRNIALAQGKGKGVTTLCTGCAMTLKIVNHEMQHFPLVKEKVNNVLGKIGIRVNGGVDVKHLIQVLFEEVGLDAIKSAVTKPLDGLNVALHYGCHLLRPSGIMKVDDPFHPSKADQVIEALGAKSVDYTEKLLCCAHGVSSFDDNIATTLNQKKFKSMVDAGADLICVFCPSCYLRLESGQRNVKKQFGEAYKIPVVYFTDLLAIAFGHGSEEIGLRFHRPDPTKKLVEKGILYSTAYYTL
ncbi:MAG: CoB--CoM heterodisulfide reductase iron-sulfur subunit B family protein [Candidatus Hodarchaeota archaeon]